MANRTPKSFLLLSLFSFFDALQKRKDDDGEQNSLGLSSSFFVFVFLMRFKNERDDDGEQNTLGFNIFDADTIPRSKPRRCGEWKAAPNPRRALDPYPCRSRSQTPGIFVMSLSPCRNPPPPTAGSRAEHRRALIYAWQRAQHIPPHNSPFFALSPAVRGWKGLSFLLLGRRGEGLQGERVIGRNRSSFLSVTHVDSATLSYVGPRSTCHFGIWHWHPPPPPPPHTHTNSLLTLQTSIR